ncbi:MAG: hypothetical protein LBQ43_00115, partial [Holosporales bacterium]|nr:hypothetical protein [Holosporales bacterium]
MYSKIVNNFKKKGLLFVSLACFGGCFFCNAGDGGLANVDVSEENDGLKFDVSFDEYGFHIEYNDLYPKRIAPYRSSCYEFLCSFRDTVDCCSYLKSRLKDTSGIKSICLGVLRSGLGTPDEQMDALNILLSILSDFVREYKYCSSEDLSYVEVIARFLSDDAKRCIAMNLPEDGRKVRVIPLLHLPPDDMRSFVAAVSTNKFSDIHDIPYFFEGLGDCCEYMNRDETIHWIDEALSHLDNVYVANFAWRILHEKRTLLKISDEEFSELKSKIRGHIEYHIEYHITYGYDEAIYALRNCSVYHEFVEHVACESGNTEENIQPWSLLEVNDEPSSCQEVNDELSFRQRINDFLNTPTLENIDSYLAKIICYYSAFPEASRLLECSKDKAGIIQVALDKVNRTGDTSWILDFLPQISYPRWAGVEVPSEFFMKVLDFLKEHSQAELNDISEGGCLTQFLQGRKAAGHQDSTMTAYGVFLFAVLFENKDQALAAQKEALKQLSLAAMVG